MAPRALLLAWLAPTLAGTGFAVRLERDIVQRRDVLVPGHQVVELARILPPAEEPWTLVVEVPDAWVGRPRGTGLTPTALATAAAPQIQALVHAVARDVPGAQGLTPVQAAGLWAGILRCSAYENPVPVSHYREVLEPWEVLYDARAGDTLSSSLGTLLALEAAHVPARLARYPSPTTASQVAFGLAVTGEAPARSDWAWPVAGADPPLVLLPLHLKARPAAGLHADGLGTWSLAQVLAPGWDPGVAAAPAEGAGGTGPPRAPEPTPSPAPSPAPAPAPAPPPERAPRPDICAQAAAMGLACRPVDRSLDPTYLAVALAAVAGLTGAGVLALAAHARRLQAARTRQDRRRREDF